MRRKRERETMHATQNFDRTLVGEGRHGWNGRQSMLPSLHPSIRIFIPKSSEKKHEMLPTSIFSKDGWKGKI